MTRARKRARDRRRGNLPPESQSLVCRGLGRVRAGAEYAARAATGPHGNDFGGATTPLVVLANTLGRAVATHAKVTGGLRTEHAVAAAVAAMLLLLLLLEQSSLRTHSVVPWPPMQRYR